MSNVKISDITSFVTSGSRGWAHIMQTLVRCFYA